MACFIELYKATSVALSVRNLDTSLGRLLKATPRSLYPWQRDPVLIVQ